MAFAIITLTVKDIESQLSVASFDKGKYEQEKKLLLSDKPLSVENKGTTLVVIYEIIEKGEESWWSA